MRVQRQKMPVISVIRDNDVIFFNKLRDTDRNNFLTDAGVCGAMNFSDQDDLSIRLDDDCLRNAGRQVDRQGFSGLNGRWQRTGTGGY